MLGFIITSNYDALFAPTVRLIDEFTPIFVNEIDIYEKSLINKLKYKISKLDGIYIEGLVSVIDNALVFKDDVKYLSSNSNNPIDKVSLPLFRMIPPKFYGRSADISEL